MLIIKHTQKENSTENLENREERDDPTSPQEQLPRAQRDEVPNFQGQLTDRTGDSYIFSMCSFTTMHMGCWLINSKEPIHLYVYVCVRVFYSTTKN